MRNSALARLLARLMPRDVARELFEPAVLDLHGEAARTGRGTGVRTFLLFLECWRLAPAEVLSMFFHDVRHALRLLGREPGFTAAAVLTLALGIGANVAVFAVVNAALLRPLPYPDADSLVLLEHRDRRTGLKKDFIALGDFVDLRGRQQAFESLAAYTGGPATIFGEGEPFDVAILQPTPNLLDLLRVRPVAGRALTADDAKEGAAPVVMIGYDTWQQRFGGDAAVIGRSIRIGTTMRQIVGIAPRGFRFPANARTDVIMPKRVPEQAPAQRKSGWVFAVARLKSGASLDQANAELSSIARQMEQEFPVANQGSEYSARTVRDAMVGDTKRALLLLLAAVSAVLLIACVNVANLIVGRAVGRRQEMAMRVALGAGRARLVAQSLTENLVLAAFGALAGIIVARWLTVGLVNLVPASVNLAALGEVGLDGQVLAFTAGVTLFTTLVFGVASAFGIRVDNAVGALVNPGRVTSSAAARRASSALVVVEVALAIVLLTGAGLVLRSFARLLAIDPGFTTDRVLTLDISLPSDRYRDAPARSAFYTRAFDELRRLNGVESVGAATVTPLTGNNWTVAFDRADRPVPAGQRPPDVGWQSATGGYFTVLQIPLRAGRLFQPTDRPGGPAVVIISEAIAERFFPGEDPVGRRVRGGGPNGAEIVGVVGNIRRAALTDAPHADMYFPNEQAPQNSTSLFIRTTADPRDSIADVRSTLRGIEPLIVLREIQTMDDVARQSVQITTLALWLLGAFALTALSLASVGIYGVMSYAVRQRTREIGTRLALGATPANIRWMVMRDGITIAGLGAVLGLAGGFAAASALSDILFATSTRDPLTLGAATAILLLVALTACYLPARRATLVGARESLLADR
jgi:putative ABC transport system permease protein